MDEMNFPSNSKYVEKKPAQATPEKKEIKKVVSGNVKIKKHNSLKDSIIPDDVNDIKNHIVFDVIIPTAKDIVLDVVKAFLYGSTAPSSQKQSYGSKVSYKSYYDRSNGQEYRSRYDKPQKQSGYSDRNGYMFGDIIFDSKMDADNVLMELGEIISSYGYATVSDLNQAMDVTGQWTDNRYGWTDLSLADVVRVREGWLLKLPKAMPLD